MSSQKTTFSATENGQSAATTVEAVTKSVQSNLASSMEVPKKFFEANLDTGAELLAFMGRRMKAQSELWSGLGHCKDLSEATEMQKAFMEKVTKDYTVELSQLTEIARKNLDVMSSLAPKKSSEISSIRERM